jgi:hypothetical protein
MSKKNRKPWRALKPVAPSTSPAVAPPASAVHAPSEPAPSVATNFSPISPAQLLANRANSQLSTGPRTLEGKARSSQNAVKSALTGRTVLLPTDDVEEYASFLAELQRDLKPVGQTECELVQIIVDCFWRLRRIQTLEFALYAHGHEQFEHAFDDYPEASRPHMILLQTHITYEKQLRNLQIQEARIDRKRAKSVAELQQLQAERESVESGEPLGRAVAGDEANLSEEQLFAAFDHGFIPPYLASQFAATKPASDKGFVFSTASSNGNREPKENHSADNGQV